MIIYNPEDYKDIVLKVNYKNGKKAQSALCQIKVI